MGKEVFVKAATLEEAIGQALRELGLKKRKDLEIELLTEPYLADRLVELKAYRRTSPVLPLDRNEGIQDIEISGPALSERKGIRTCGNVRIGGDAGPSLYIESGGDVSIGGSVQKSIIEAERHVRIKGNVLSSTIHVGVRDALENDLSLRLEGVVHYLEHVEREVWKVLDAREHTPGDVDAAELSRLFHWILEEKFLPFQRMKQEFIRKVEDNVPRLSDDWEVLADRLRYVLSDTAKSGVQDASDFSSLVQRARLMHDRHAEDGRLDSFLELPYAVSSVLSCNGTIHVHGKGLYNCSVSARRDIEVEGVCRGGELLADHRLSIREAGSKSGAKTVLKTGVNGSISIGKAHAGTELWIGTHCLLIEYDQLGVFARMQDGELAIS